jgi:hypothetical protein
MSRPALFAPLDIAGRRLRNRIGFAAMSTRFPAGGRVTERMVAHLAARAAGGAALVVTEALSAAASAATPARVAAHDDAALPGLAALAEAVSRHGALPVGQLWHGGSAHHGPRGLDAVGPSAVPDPMSWTVPRILSDAEIEGLVEEYAAAAHRLRRAGFAGVEVSAAHGFLPLQFLSPVTNRREDRWGGDAAGRSRFVRAILRAVRERCGADFLLLLKLPADDFVPGSIDAAEAARLVAAIVADAPPHLLCFSQGSHGWSLHRHVPDMHEPVAPYRPLWRALRAAAGAVPVAAIGRIATPATAEEILAAGEAEMVMLARPLLADPRWAEKAASGRAASITPCIHCNACWGEIHRNAPIGCSVNPHVGTGRDGSPPARAAAPRHLVVVGAGMAGLQAAVAAAERGHRVTLLGRTLGGGAALHARLPGCAEIFAAVAHLADRARAAGVVMRLGAEADAAAVLALRPAAVVLATGAAMARCIPGARDLRTAAAALLDDTSAGGDLAVLLDEDATPATYGAAELLAARFRHLVLATPREVIARDCPVVVAQGVHRRLAALGVELRTCRGGIALQRGVLRLRHVLTGAEEEVPGVSLLVHAAARVPRDGLAPALRAAGLDVRLAGDALSPRQMLSAVRDGQAVSETI